MGFWRSSYVRIGQSSARSSAILYARRSRTPDGPASTLRMARVSRPTCDPRCYRLPPHKPLLSREALVLWVGLQPLRQVADIWPLRPADNQPNPCGSQFDTRSRDGAIALGIAGAPSVVDAHIAPDDPAQFGEPLQERCVEGLKFGIVCHSGHKYPDAPHPFRLLRARRERPASRRRRAA